MSGHPYSKRALVTGATGGIGQVVVQRLVQEGYHVIACGRRPEALEVLKASAPDNITPLVCNLQCSWERIQHHLTVAHPMSLLVCAHGAAPVTTPTLELCQEEVVPVWETDVSGTVAVCQAVGRHMVARRQGCICLISSIHAHATYPARLPYAVAKAAIVAVARSLAVEWGPYGVSTNVLLPWQTVGPRTEHLRRAAMGQGEDLIEAYLQRCPQRRLITPEEIAETILWLTRTPAVNGAEIVLDGGVTRSMWYKPFREQAHVDR